MLSMADAHGDCMLPSCRPQSDGSCSSFSTSTRQQPLRSGLPPMDGVLYFINTDVPGTKAASIRSILSRNGAQEWTSPPQWREERRRRTKAAYDARLEQPDRTSSDAQPPSETYTSWRFDPDVVTHVITGTINLPEYDACGDPMADGEPNDRDRERATVVTPEWVFRSNMLSEPQSERYFSPNPAFIFSGKVIHPSRMSRSETELILAAVCSLGGHFRMNLTKGVTHVVTPSEDSIKLRALRQPDHRHLGITAVHPAWINECIKLNRLVNHGPFAWPLTSDGKPAYLYFDDKCFTSSRSLVPDASRSTDVKSAPKVHDGENETSATMGSNGIERPHYSSLLPKQRDLNGLFRHAPSDPKKRTRFYRYRDAFQGLKILFVGDGIGKLPSEMVELLSYNVKDHGGQWIPLPPHARSLPQAVARADVVIASHRDVPAAYWALYLNKRLANIWWLWWVTTYGRLVEPMDHLLHFPASSQPIAQFDQYTFGLSNYSGEGRSYLKELIGRAGAHWTPELTSKNTHLIAGSAQGAKVAKAGVWQIKVVNHLWLEDCYATWSNLSLDRTRVYTDLNTAVPLPDVMGHVAIDRTALTRWKQEACEWVVSRSVNDGYAIPVGLQNVSPPGPPLEQAHQVQQADLRSDLVLESNFQSVRPESQVATSEPPGFAPGLPPTEPNHELEPEPVHDYEPEPEPKPEPEPEPEPIPHRFGLLPPLLPPESFTVLSQTVQARREQHHDPDQMQDQDHAQGRNRELHPPTESTRPDKRSRHHTSDCNFEWEQREQVISATADKSTTRYPSKRARRSRKSLGVSTKVSKSQASGPNSDPATQAPRPVSQDQSSMHTSGSRRRRLSGRTSSRRSRTRYYATTSIELASHQEKSLRRRGWSRSTEVTEQTSVLVASSLTRTEKMLCAIGLGIPVVSTSWINTLLAQSSGSLRGGWQQGEHGQSGDAGPQVDPEEFILHAPLAEQTRNVNLRVVLSKRQDAGQGILQGHTFYFTPHVKPNTQVLRSIVQAAGGQAPKTSGASLPQDDLLAHPQMIHLISSNKDRGLWSNWIREACSDGSALRVWNAELLLDGILRQNMRWELNKLHG